MGPTVFKWVKDRNCRTLYREFRSLNKFYGDQAEKLTVLGPSGTRDVMGIVEWTCNYSKGATT